VSSHAIRVLCEAGVTDDVVPDFRTMPKSSQNTLHISAYDSSEATGRFHTLIRNISRFSALAKPTNFHTFLESLALSGHLLRHYTQNIDCVEGHLPELWAKTVQLHGRIDQAVCQSCRWTVPFLVDSFCRPHLPDCQRCEEVVLEREKMGKRHRGIGRLRPNVVLYGEDNPNGDTIGKVAERDLRTGPDMVIVVGTGLKVPGAKRLVKEFCRSVKSRGGLAVWINKDPVPSGLKVCFDSTFQRDCDDVVSLLSV